MCRYGSKSRKYRRYWLTVGPVLAQLERWWEPARPQFQVHWLGAGFQIVLGNWSLTVDWITLKGGEDS